MACWILPARAADPPRRWKLGEALDRQLDMPSGVVWDGLPLRDALDRLAEVQRVALFLDRRIDPGQTVRLVSQRDSLREVLDQLAQSLGAQAVRIGPVVYLGPEPEADIVATTAALRGRSLGSKLPPPVRARWLATAAWSWPKLSTPRDLVEQLAAAADLTVEGLERIPHDLWPAAELPPMTLADRLSLVLAGFQLTFELTDEAGRGIVIVPLPAEARLRKTYALPPEERTPDQKARAAARMVAQFRRDEPSASLQRSGNRVVVEATWSGHDRFQRMLRELTGKTSAASEPAGQVYTLRVKNQTVGAVAKALADRLGRRLEADPRTNPQLRKLVSFEVTDATLDELLHAVFDPAELQFELDQERLRVFR